MLKRKTHSASICYGHDVSLDDVRRIIPAAERRAQEISRPMNIAVVDRGGSLVAHARMDGWWIGGVAIAIDKAYAARAFHISTQDLAGRSESGGQYFGIHNANDGRVVIFAGGSRLKQEDTVVAAHVSAAVWLIQDQAVAEGVAAAF